MDKFVAQNNVDKSSYHLLEDQKILVFMGHHAQIAQSDLCAPEFLLARSVEAII